MNNKDHNRAGKGLKMELLAPAGDWDGLLAALAGGADAVYLGSKAFSARQYASNFDMEHLKQAADLLHLHRKKIYVTVNTLISDAEMSQAIDLLGEIYNIGIDAVIIQDLGLIGLAQKYFPQLELHASTQMTVHNGAGALYLKKLGIKRIVLARELTKEEVQAIKEASGLEVEVFIHGALCVCYSGQCLFSSMIGGRSGNRGRCAQPCRLEYQLFRDKEKIKTRGNFLLSPKDLALAEMIPELDRAGVTSLKIEGRMKRPEYVYTVVKTYRRLLDRYTENPDEYRVEPEELRKLSETFNRGFTTGYFGGKRNREIISVSRPNNRGVFLGRIINLNQDGLLSLRLDTDLAGGDLVEVWVSQGGRISATIEFLYDQCGNQLPAAKAGETVAFKVDGKVYPGDRVFKIASAQLRNETKQALDPENPKLKIPCKAVVFGSLNQPLGLIFEDHDGNQGEALSSIPLQAARNHPLTTEVLRKQLGRLGNTPFRLGEIQNQLEDGLMLPLSELNELRRRAIGSLTQKKLAPYQRRETALHFTLAQSDSQQGPKFASKLSVWVADLAGVIAAARSGADLIYAGGDELTGFHWDKDALTRAYEETRSEGAKLVIGLPRINREGQRGDWYKYFNILLQTENDGIIVSDPGGLELAISESDRPLYLNYTFNFFNQWSFRLPNRERIKQVTLSPELSLNQIIGVLKGYSSRDPALECLVQGPLELMISEYCPIGSLVGEENGACRRHCKNGRYYLKDRLKLDFPIFTDQYCRMHLLNSVDLCLYPDLEKLAQLPLTLRLELKTFDAKAVDLFVKRYKQKKNGKMSTDSQKVIEEFQKITGRGITKGHYFRGVE